MRTLADYLGFLQLGWKDAIEILLVAYLIYRVLVLWTGTRAFQILVGLVLLVAVYAVAQLLALGLITAILSQAFTYGVFALIVVFQPELRNALAQLGRSRLWNVFARFEESEVVEEVVKAAERLARAKIGGIIAVEREVGLGEYADKGTRFEADVSSDLLTTIFTPYSPLHDGAVLIRGDKIIAAGAPLPLTQFPVRDKSLGMRHRAAIGLSEETDAYVVVISEETSQISLAIGGQLFRGMDQDRLRAHLSRSRSMEPPPPREGRRWRDMMLRGRRGGAFAATSGRDADGGEGNEPGFDEVRAGR
ncbi:MAG: diadenylate cyclase CdaA [Gemmatimonadetes bacterium]|jgi:diadenylate cyclase|nr:diadenylate cyclase CdaA [Gemmatimonadota bacterium]